MVMRAVARRPAGSVVSPHTWALLVARRFASEPFTVLSISLRGVAEAGTGQQPGEPPADPGGADQRGGHREVHLDVGDRSAVVGAVEVGGGEGERGFGAVAEVDAGGASAQRGRGDLAVDGDAASGRHPVQDRLDGPR